MNNPKFPSDAFNPEYLENDRGWPGGPALPQNVSSEVVGRARPPRERVVAPNGGSRPCAPKSGAAMKTTRDISALCNTVKLEGQTVTAFSRRTRQRRITAWHVAGNLLLRIRWPAYAEGLGNGQPGLAGQGSSLLHQNSGWAEPEMFESGEADPENVHFKLPVSA